MEIFSTLDGNKFCSCGETLVPITVCLVALYNQKYLISLLWFISPITNMFYTHVVEDPPAPVSGMFLKYISLYVLIFIIVYSRSPEPSFLVNNSCYKGQLLKHLVAL